LGFPHGMSVKFGLWTFHELLKRQKILTLLSFGCPSYHHQCIANLKRGSSHPTWSWDPRRKRFVMLNMQLWQPFTGSSLSKCTSQHLLGLFGIKKIQKKL